jgi:hypothetical protein
VQAHALPVVQKWDGVLKEHFDAVEVEALGQGVVIGIIRAVLDSLLPAPLLDVQVRERVQRRQARRRLLDQDEDRATALGLLAEAIYDVRAIGQDAGLEQVFSGDSGAWFAFRARLQSIEAVLDEVGEALTAPDSDEDAD